MTHDTTTANSDLSGVTPALVRLYDQQQILEMSQDTAPEARVELVSIITSLLEMELSPRESELVADVLISLMRQIERDLCAALAHHLAAMDAVPLRLALHMANQSIDVAAPILQHSPVFSDIDLMYIIKSKSADYWQAIAKREGLSRNLTHTLASCKDVDTALALADNQAIALDDQVLRTLIQLAQTHSHEDLSYALILRDEMTQDIAKTLYRCASVAIRHHIAEHFEIPPHELKAIMDQITEDVDQTLTQSRSASVPSDYDRYLDIARRYKQKGELTIDMMVKTLKRSQHRAFAAQLAVMLGIDLALAAQIVKQKSGKSFAISCKTLEIERNNFLALFMLLSRLRNGGKMVDASVVAKASRDYDSISDENAQTLMHNIRTSGQLID